MRGKRGEKRRGLLEGISSIQPGANAEETRELRQEGEQQRRGHQTEGQQKEKRANEGEKKQKTTGQQQQAKGEWKLLSNEDKQTLPERSSEFWSEDEAVR